MKKLCRSTHNKMIAGVCAGIAEYLDVDPTLVRILWVLGSLCLGGGFGGVVAYIIFAIIMPENPISFE